MSFRCTQTITINNLGTQKSNILYRTYAFPSDMAVTSDRIAGHDYSRATLNVKMLTVDFWGSGWVLMSLLTSPRVRIS